MIVKSIQIAGSSLLAISLSFGLVSAQEDASPEAQEASEESQSDSRSPAQILADARASLDKMESSADNIARALRSAREEKDVVMTLCLDDKLNQMNVAARSAADRVASIEAAVASGNSERVNHDDAVLGALALRGSELAAEANQCIGEDSGTLGSTTLELKVDPAIPKSDTASPAAPVIVSSPPVAASPTS